MAQVHHHRPTRTPCWQPTLLTPTRQHLVLLLETLIVSNTNLITQSFDQVSSCKTKGHIPNTHNQHYKRAYQVEHRIGSATQYLDVRCGVWLKITYISLWWSNKNDKIPSNVISHQALYDIFYFRFQVALNECTKENIKIKRLKVLLTELISVLFWYIA